MGFLLIRLWAQNPSSIQPEAAPTSSYDQDASTVAVPFYRHGTLYLSQVNKSGGEATTEMSRQTVGTAPYRLADVNRLTGHFLYQTLDNGREDINGVTTWLADASGKSTRVYTGAGHVRLSPSGRYIAATDGKGVLHIVDQTGREHGSFGYGSGTVFSNNGRRIAFFRTVPFSISDEGGLAVVDLASGKTIATYDPDGETYMPIAFSKDGNTVFFAAKTKSPNSDPSNTNRVDVYALSLSNGTSQLLTTGAEKLPYMDYTRILYLSDSNLLVLSAENTVWTVNVNTGTMKTYDNIADVMWSGSGNTLLVRSSGEGDLSPNWNSLTVQ